MQGGESKRDRRKDNAAATQAALLAAGFKLFGTQGFEATSVSALCVEAGVTSGALYHHFGDKKGLFAAVAEELDASLVKRAQAARSKSLAADADPWRAFEAAVASFLRAGSNPSGRRIGLTDAAAVLGAAQWTQIRERHGLGAMIATVQALQEFGLMVAGDSRRLARLILGLLYGAVESLPEQATEQTMAETRRLVLAMLTKLRPAAES